MGDLMRQSGCVTCGCVVWSPDAEIQERHMYVTGGFCDCDCGGRRQKAGGMKMLAVVWVEKKEGGEQVTDGRGDNQQRSPRGNPSRQGAIHVLAERERDADLGAYLGAYVSRLWLHQVLSDVYSSHSTNNTRALRAQPDHPPSFCKLS